MSWCVHFSLILFTSLAAIAGGAFLGPWGPWNVSMVVIPLCTGAAIGLEWKKHAEAKEAADAGTNLGHRGKQQQRDRPSPPPEWGRGPGKED